MILVNIVSLSAEKRVILKFDDLRQISRYEEAFIKTQNLINEEKVKASFGIITADLENIKPSYRKLVEKILADENIEIFQHGHTHIKNKDNGEYRGTSYEEQLRSITFAQNGLKNNFNFIPTTFGAPYNHTDENTNKALLVQEDIKKVFFMADRKDGLIYFNNRINMENGTGKVDFEFFKKNLEEAKYGKNLIILQGHPDKWYDENNYYLELIKILNYLKANGYTFVLPRDVK